MLPDPAAFHRNRKRRENILIFLPSVTLLIIAGGALWYMLLQPRGKVRDQASAPVSPTTELPKAPTAPAPAVKPAAPQPPPVPPSTAQPSAPQVPPVPPPSAQPTAPQPQPSPSVAPAAKQAAPLPQPATPAAPTTQPTTQLASSVRVPEMTELRGGSFAMGSNEDISESRFIR